MTFTSKVKRVSYLLVVATFALAIFSAVRPEPVAAYGLLGNRYIRLSSSANGATNTAYAVGFTTVTAGQTIGSVVIEFCSNSPIIGETCNAPTGFNTNEGQPLSINSITGNITGLTLHANTTTNKVVLTRTAAAVANGAVTFVLGNGTTNGLTNPTNTNTTFFARITTHPATDGTGAETDAGGTALSTAAVLQVTAKVQETLTFCVYTGINCAAGGFAVALGDGNGVLTATNTTYTNTAKYDLASNALAGVAVKLKGDTLTSGAFTISPHGAACTADSVLTSVEQFGLRVSSLGAGQTTDAVYNCLAGNHSFDVANTNTTYGQNVTTTAGATDVSTTTIELAAKAAGTTEAGIYTTNLQLIATATY